MSESHASVVGARLTPEERRLLEHLARSNDRTASREVRRAIRFYLAHPEDVDGYLRDLEAGDEPGAADRSDYPVRNNKEGGKRD